MRKQGPEKACGIEGKRMQNGSQNGNQMVPKSVHKLRNYQKLKPKMLNVILEVQGGTGRKTKGVSKYAPDPGSH